MMYTQFLGILAHKLTIKMHDVNTTKQYIYPTSILFPGFGRGVVGRGDSVGKLVGDVEGAVSHSCSARGINWISPP